MLVAFARMAEALIIMPGIFTNLAICSDCKMDQITYWEQQGNCQTAFAKCYLANCDSRRCPYPPQGGFKEITPDTPETGVSRSTFLKKCMNEGMQVGGQTNVD